MPDFNEGGLNYQINVGGNFDKVLSDFEARVDRLEKRASKVIGGRAKSAPVVSSKEVTDVQKIEKSTGATSEAIARNNKLMRELGIKHQQVNELSKRLNISHDRAASLIGVSSAQAKQLKLNLFDAEKVARQFLFTFRRLVGILALFTLARKLAQNIGAAVREMGDFNAELEIAEIGIAQIVASVGEVRDETGNLATGAEAFRASLQASQGLINQIKRDALGSIATFEALVKAFQVAVGPGLAAGLDLDQIRTLSKRLAEGAIALGVPLNQLSEEIRSLLQGTATARNTRIAVLFGGAKEANEAIRRAKEEGNLFEVLTERLQGVADGANAAEQSLDVLRSNLQDTVQLLLAEGGVEQFNALKESILAFTQALRDTDAEGNIIFKPEVVGIVQEVASTLAGVSKSFREVTDTGQALVFLRNVLATLGDVLNTIAPLVSAVFQGLITGANLALAPIRAIVDGVRVLARGLGLQSFNKFLANNVKLLVAGATALTIWSLSLKTIASLKVVETLASGLKLVVGRLIAVSALQDGVNAKLFISTLVTQGWAAAWTLVNTQALITGGLFTILLAGLAFLVTKTKLWERFIGRINKALGTGADSAEDLEKYLFNASEETSKGAKSAEEWVDAIEDLQRELLVTRGIKGLTGEAKDLATILQTALSDFGKATNVWQVQEKAAEKSLGKIEEDIKALRDSIFEITKADLGETGLVVSLGTPIEDLTDAQFDAYQKALQKASESFTKATTRPEIIDGKITTISEELNKKSDELNVKLLEQARLQEQIASYKQKQLEALELQVAIFRVQNPEELRLFKASLATAEANEAIQKASADTLTAVQRTITGLEAQKAVVEARVALAEEERKIAISTLKTNIIQAEKLGASAEVRNELQAELNTLVEETTRQRGVEAAEVASITRELDTQLKLLEGDLPTALSEGLNQFLEDLPTVGQAVADAISEGLDGVASSFGATFREYLETGEDVRYFFLNALSDVFLNIAEQFATDVASRLLSSLAEGAISQIGAQAAAGQSAGGLAAGFSTLLAGIGTLFGSLFSFLFAKEAKDDAKEVAKTGVETARITAQTSAIVAAIAAQTAAQVPLLGQIAFATTADAVTPFAKGGMVKGYASGGTIAGIPRPSHIPASDTVPAWLTPGEFVIKRSMVQKYGTGLLDALNRGRLPSSFAMAGPSLRQASSAVQHFATGGSVGGSSFASDSSVPRPVNVAFFDDRNALRKWTESTEGETAILSVMKKNSYLFK